MPEIILGLDVGSQNIKIALAKRDKRFALLGAAVVKTPDGAVLDGEIAYTGGIAQVLKGYIAESGAKPDCIAACVNSPNIVTRLVRLPGVAQPEVPAAVRFELLKLFPSIKETHAIAQKAVSSDAESAAVFAALCPNSLLGAYSALSDELGIPLKYADVRANAQAKALARFFGLERGETGLIVDLGYRSTQISVVSNGCALVSRQVAAGVAAYDAMLAERAGVSRADAEKARQGGDFSGIGLDASELARIAGACFAEIEEQARQTVEFYEYEKPKEHIGFAAAIGEGGLIPDIDGFFAAPLGLKPRTLPASAPGVPAGGHSAKLLAAAVGACLQDGARPGQDINFVEKPEAGRGGQAGGALSRLVPVAFAAAAALLALSILASVYFGASRRSAASQIESIKDSISADSGVSELEARIKDAERKLDDAQSVSQALAQSGADAAGALEALTREAPEDLFVVSLNMLSASEIALTGKSKDYGSIANFALLLRESGEYGSVSINSISANRLSSDEIADYGFTMTLRV
ncbi:MAG: pilus assembly protein PilM [Clostridiales bacterium]|nr:pilus assembly protein PilM [Clostridiales bacterium]